MFEPRLYSLQWRTFSLLGYGLVVTGGASGFRNMCIDLSWNGSLFSIFGVN